MQKFIFFFVFSSSVLFLFPLSSKSRTPLFRDFPSNNNRDTAFKKNIISFHLLDVAYNEFTFSYERLTRNGMFGLKVPFSVGYSDDDYEDFKSLYYIGAGMNIYVTGQGKLRYVMGPHFRFGRASSYERTYDEINYTYVQKEYEFPYVKFFVDNGIAYTPVKNYTLSAILSLGVKYFDKEPVNNSGLTNSAHFTICMSYRF